MTTAHASLILILIGLISCNSSDKNSTQQTNGDTIQNVTSDTFKESHNDTILNISSETFKDLLPTTKATRSTEGIPSFIVDDFPVTNKMLSEAHAIMTKEIIDSEGAWFSNDTLNQTLVFVTYTDYHRLITYHFLNSDIPKGIIERMQLNDRLKDGSFGLGDIASYKQKQNNFKGFIAQAKKISETYFTSKKGFKLGDSKEKALDVYGNPDSILIKNGVEKYEWDFIGDAFYCDTMDLKGKPLARNNYGHQIILFYRDNKLIGLILHNDIP